MYQHSFLILKRLAGMMLESFLPVEKHGLRERSLDSAEDDDDIDCRLSPLQQPLMYRFEARGLVAVGEGDQYPGATGVAPGEVNGCRSRQGLQELVYPPRDDLASGIANQVQHQPVTGVPTCMLST